MVEIYGKIIVHKWVDTEGTSEEPYIIEAKGVKYSHFNTYKDLPNGRNRIEYIAYTEQEYIDKKRDILYQYVL